MNFMKCIDKKWLENVTKHSFYVNPQTFFYFKMIIKNFATFFFFFFNLTEQGDLSCHILCEENYRNLMEWSSWTEKQISTTLEQKNNCKEKIKTLIYFKT